METFQTLSKMDIRLFGSPKMGAFVEYALRTQGLLDEGIVTPAVSPVVTSDGFVISNGGLVCTAAEVEENWQDMLDHFGIDFVPFPWQSDWRTL